MVSEVGNQIVRQTFSRLIVSLRVLAVVALAVCVVLLPNDPREPNLVGPSVQQSNGASEDDPLSLVIAKKEDELNVRKVVIDSSRRKEEAKIRDLEDQMHDLERQMREIKMEHRALDLWKPLPGREIIRPLVF